MRSNSAAWLPPKHADLSVSAAPYTPPRANEIVVKNHAVAVNPIDWIIQCAGDVIFPWIKYPFVLGSDLSGEVVEVGSGSSRFKVGDRVVAHAVGGDKKRNSSAEGAFQDYTVVLSHMASPIPDAVSYERAAVIPLGLSTAACGLFQKDHLALQYPSATARATGKTVIIWGGSTSVGCNAIQLAVAAGYEVITTASPRNFDLVKTLGASEVFDYNSKTVVRDIVAAIKGKEIGGALAIGSTSALACLDIVGARQGNKFVSMASFPMSFEGLVRGANPRLHLLRQFPKLVPYGVSLLFKSLARRIRMKAIFGTTLMDNEVSRIIYEDFLPVALAERRFVAAPEPYVVGRGLDCLQAAFDIQKKGVSAKKVVVTL